MHPLTARNGKQKQLKGRRVYANLIGLRRFPAERKFQLSTHCTIRWEEKTVKSIASLVVKRGSVEETYFLVPTHHTSHQGECRGRDEGRCCLASCALHVGTRTHLTPQRDNSTVWPLGSQWPHVPGRRHAHRPEPSAHTPPTIATLNWRRSW